MFEPPKTVHSLLPILDQATAEEEAPPLGGMRFLDLPPEVRKPSYGLLGGEGDNGAVRAVLSRVETLLRLQEHARIDLSGLSAEEMGLLGELLGEGEVRGVAFTQAGEHRFRESVLPGVWRIRTHDPSGRLRSEALEIADVPSVVREANETRTEREMAVPEVGPQGTMNALPMLNEIKAKMLQPIGEHNHIVSFTNMPVTATDMDLLEATIGTGPVVCESLGYGTCRVQLTGKRNVWSVQHMNSMGAVILDTIEIGDVPVSLLAAAEDFEDSAERIRELMEGA